MKKLLYLLFVVTVIGCSDNDSTEPVLGIDNLSLVLNGQVLKHNESYNSGTIRIATNITEFTETSTRNKYTFFQAIGQPSDELRCWLLCGGGDSEIKIESPNYIEYFNGNNITLIDGKLYYKRSLEGDYRSTYEMFESSLKEIEDLKVELEIKCPGACS
tara:strand:+ start:1346 stop:1822 length:477 start_codon:yes stop_codon:yes gene_type:complete